MLTEIGKITAKGQTTIPTALRKAIDLSKGDEIMFSTSGDKIIIRKVTALDKAYYKSLEAGFAHEWNSKADDEAFNDL